MNETSATIAAGSSRPRKRRAMRLVATPAKDLREGTGVASLEALEAEISVSTPPVSASPESFEAELPRKRKAVNLREVARQADVSVATVSMVLNANPRISRPTHLRVQRVIDKLGYQPNRLAQSLASKHTRVLAVLLPALRHGFGDAYFGELISGVCDRAGKLNYKVMLEQAKPDFVKSRGHLELFERRYVDGVLALGCNDRHPFLAEFQDRRHPLIVVDNYFKKWDLDYVVCNYRNGTDQVMNYLLSLGHRAIGFINAAPEVQTAMDRQEIYDQKFRAVGVTPVKTWSADGRFTEEGGAAAAEVILKKHPEITAIFAGNDKMAIGAMNYLHHHGIRVPTDVSVVGFDDMRHSAFVVPSLTTVHLPLYEVGSMACERLVERIHGKIARVAEDLPTHLVLRESTGLARTSTVARTA